MVQIGVPSPKVVIMTPTYFLELDASINETHERKADITQFPIEQNSVITDHVVFQPIELQIQGIISNTLLLTFTAVPPPSVPEGDPSSRAEDAFTALEKLMREGTRCDIKTTLVTYINMVLVSLSTPRDAARGNMAELNMHWREIRFAETESVETPEPVAPQQDASTSLGKQQANPVDAKTAAKNKQSALDKLAHAGGA